MRRKLHPTVVQVAKRFLFDFRSPCCQHVHPATAAAVPCSMPATLLEGTALNLALTSRATGFVSPEAVKVQGEGRSRLWRSHFSTQQQHTQQEGPDFSQLDLTLQQQWDVAANAHLGSIAITPHSSKKVWWLCDQCPDGHVHSWSASVDSRSNGSGCPQCSGHKVCKHNSLATKAPGVAAQWDYEENDGTPDDFVGQSCQLAHWLCDACGHKWSVRIFRRVSQSTGCPECAKVKKWIRRPSFAVHPLLAEWDHDRNSVLGNYPDSTTLQSHKRIFWLCRNCPAGQQHSWSARGCDRTGRIKRGCPFCAGQAACRCNSLQALYPDTAAEWDYSKNKGQASDYCASSKRSAWWISPQRGSWQQTIHSRTSVVHQRTARLWRVQQRQTPHGSSQADCGSRSDSKLDL